MRSTAGRIKGQGVGSCYEEQVGLMKRLLPAEFSITENRIGKFDIEHYHTINPAYLLERMLTRRDTVGIGYVHFLPETLEESLRLPCKRIVYKYLLAFYNSMDYLVTVNPFFIPKLRALGVTRPKVLYIPNFVSDRDFYPVTGAERAEIRKRYGIGADDFVVLGVGQLQTRKGVLDFVKTAARLPECVFLWAGGFSFGKLSDGYAEIRKLTETPPENVRFLGITSRTEMPKLYNLADVFFLPSYDELFPMSILEAMCCKLPVLVRDISLYQSILENACLTGRDPASFADAIGRLGRDPGFYSNWREKAWQCHLRYSEERALDEWRQLYEIAYAEARTGGAGAAALG